MKLTLASRLLFGALIASTALNVYHARSAAGDAAYEAQAPARSDEAPTEPCVLANSGGARPPCRRITDALDLNETQTKRFENCCPTYVQKRESMRSRLDAVFAELDKALNAKQIDRKLIHQLVDEISKVRTNELRGCVDGILQVRETLTPSQLERLVSFCSQEQP